MKIRSIQDKVVVNLNKKFFVLGVLPYVKYAINDFSWNERVLEGYEDILILKDTDVYYGEWVDANILVHEVTDYDNLARYLMNLIPRGFGYFYLITSKFVLTLPYHLLIKILPSDDLESKRYHRIMN